MCGIAAIYDLRGREVPHIDHKLKIMSQIIAHRGPDGKGKWLSKSKNIGLAHRRLSIIDLSTDAAQPMIGNNQAVISFNGEIYNYKELRKKLSPKWDFKSNSDTEVILAAYAQYGQNCVDHFRGMFAFVIWDDTNKTLFCARDRFGIKPIYYAIVDDVFILASEAKALVPFLKEIATDPDALAEYLTFQYTISDQTLFKGIKQLLPAHTLTFKNSSIQIKKYWDVSYNIDHDHSAAYFTEKLKHLLDDSINIHTRSDVPIGSYVSGGIDSSLISLLTAKKASLDNSFNGKFTQFHGYDESSFAQIVCNESKSRLRTIDITADDFRDNIENVIYHLDFPIAGPGSFPQFMVSKLASETNKVVLGGQGGDELFGGYARYVVAYLEQCLKAAIDGNYKNGDFVVTIESIIPNLGLLREYKPMIKEFWREGLFGDLDERYFRLVDRSSDMEKEINWELLDKTKVFEKFQNVFNSPSNVKKAAYFDSMTHFDFKCLLPALLHVEDRMGMAHGLETRVPFLDHPLVEFAATIPADIKFKDGNMKHMLKKTYQNILPNKILERRDKMGFPVPLKEWMQGELNDFIQDIFSNIEAKNRDYIDVKAARSNFQTSGQFSRKTWGLLSLELWFQQFHDKSPYYRSLLN